MTNKKGYSPFKLFLANVLFLSMLGILDWASGYELQFFIFYFIPIAVTAWVVGFKHSYLVAITSTTIWFLADWYSGHQYANLLYAYWNTAIRFLSFMLVAYTISRIKVLLDHERKISENLQKALSEVKTLKGLLPICAQCKKIRNDQGYWLRIEEYISQHSEAQFTHGICQECSAKALKEAGFEHPGSSK